MPRVCGGTPHRRRQASTSGGLSPRVRGNRRTRATSSSATRSIPACAGEPRGRRRTPGWPGVYPRVCGGTAPVESAAQMKAGLSPRVRGNHRRDDPGARLPGSIPACAGEPRTRTQTPPGPGVYPRVCGGTHDLSRMVLAMVGSIPACAGEPLGAGDLRHRAGVYPRVCGGTISVGLCLATVRGLSPRVRGNRGSFLSCAS